ncbi:MazG family protein [Deinococcus rubellus]|uniref:MazG family protein n=1 Tax=Deinococcus rubellus TaxID=1889240 RepID=A0ABY5YI76_9DEIO|nr:MazG family protein [Deinococcus rubellus]UWX63807.1 MazG family protein [Deinococcus rubellus]
MLELLKTMRRLRAPDGCPWDQEQTHASLRPYLLEEAAEAADAISAGDLGELRGELGDVLLQVAFHSVIAEAAGEFSYQDVEQGIVDKLVRRHPHVFGDVQVSDSEEVVSNWQSIKAQEQGGRPRSAADKVPRALGALAREAQAQKLGQRSKDPARTQLRQALDEAPGTEAGVAALLAAAVAWARGLGIDPEVALRAHTDAQLRSLDAVTDEACTGE